MVNSKIFPPRKRELTMYVKRFLHKMLSPVTHKKRLITLTLLVKTALKNKRLSLTELGRGLQLSIQERSGIRRADRFLGNKKLHKEQDDIYKAIVERMIGAKTRPDIIIDWSNIPNTTHHTLRAALVAQGRALTLYEQVHPEKKLGTKKVQNKFLQKLKTLLPDGCKPIIITDAGFHNDWFKEIVRLNWDFIGRVRGKKYLKIDKKDWQLCSSLFKRATAIPQYLGETTLCKSNPIKVNLCLFKAKQKGRKGLNKLGKKRNDSSSLDYRKSAKEPWILVTSLSKSYFLANKVIKKYTNRMQIEEGFRDLKSTRYGLGFENSYSKEISRIGVLLLIAMLASLIAWLTGWIAEKNKMHYEFQSNTIKNRRVLSLFFLGCQIIKRKMKIPINQLINAIDEDLAHVV